MSISPETIPFLTSDAGATLLESLMQDDLSDANTLKLITTLRKTYTPDQASAALETARLRLKARDKFGTDADKMLFTQSALEQASDPLVRHYRAENVPSTVLDVCCGIGADSLTFARTGAQVHGIDIDPLRIAIAQHNADVLGLSAQFSVADARETLPAGYDLHFFDPARRTETGKRIYDVEQYIPPLSLIKSWSVSQIMVKLSPGVDLSQLNDYGGMVEFISVNGDLKEAVLHVGTLTDAHPVATLLTDDTVYHWRRESEPETRPISEPRQWLIEPDSAIIRAGLVQDVAQAFDAYQLDEQIAYLTVDEAPQSPGVRSWKVYDWMPFNLKQLRAHLREHDVGRVTVKKRGSPITPEALQSKLKLKKGDETRTLVLTRHDDAPIVLICEEYPATFN